MALQTINGATLQCSMGLTPSTFVVPPVRRTLASGSPAATVMDHMPLVNVMPFGLCRSPANPAVIAATAAALGTPTPAPCIPVTPAPWLPGVPTVLIGAIPALDQACQLACVWAGLIQFVNPGQATVFTP